MSGDRYPKRLDQDAPHDIWVKQNSGRDLLETFDSYIKYGERIGRLPKGLYLLPEPLRIGTTPVSSRSMLFKGGGKDNTFIKGDGSAAFADLAVIKSDKTGWSPFDALNLENLTVQGSGVEQYVIDATYLLVNMFGDVEISGALRAAGDGIGLFSEGSGPPSTPMTIQNLSIVPSSGTWATGLKTKYENSLIGNIAVSEVGANVLTGVKMEGVSNFRIENIGAFIGAGASMDYLLDCGQGRGSVGTMYHNKQTGATKIPASIKNTGAVTIDHIIADAMPTGLDCVCADTDTKNSVWIHQATYSPFGTSVTKVDAGTSYVLMTDLGDCTIDLTHWTRARIHIQDGRGNEAGAGKGIAWYNTTNSAVLCEVLFDGIGYGGVARVGAWTNISALTGAKALRLYCKGSSATEDISTIYGAKLCLAGYR